MAGWAVWVTRCRACGHPSVDVVPAETMPPFECSVCREMAVFTDVRRTREAERM